MPDGRLFIAGGHIGVLADNAHGGVVFDPFANSGADASAESFHVQTSRMHVPRWYPTVTTLPDGRMLVSSGRSSPLPTPAGPLTLIPMDYWYGGKEPNYEVFYPSADRASDGAFAPD